MVKVTWVLAVLSLVGACSGETCELDWSWSRSERACLPERAGSPCLFEEDAEEQCGIDMLCVGEAADGGGLCVPTCAQVYCPDLDAQGGSLWDCGSVGAFLDVCLPQE